MRAADRTPSREKLSDADLDRLLEFERVERERLYRESEIWRAHRNRLLCVCLGQGTGVHLLDRSGLNDFDVLTFFAASPSLEPRRVSSSFRAGRHRDFGRLPHSGSGPTRRDVRGSPATGDATSTCSRTPSRRSEPPTLTLPFERGSPRRRRAARGCSRKRPS